MEKVKISEIGTKFNGLSKNTPSKLRYNPTEKTLILEVLGFEPLSVSCSDCNNEKLLSEGAMFRCLNCNHLFLVGFFGTNQD